MVWTTVDWDNVWSSWVGDVREIDWDLTVLADSEVEVWLAWVSWSVEVQEIVSTVVDITWLDDVSWLSVSVPVVSPWLDWDSCW